MKRYLYLSFIICHLSFGHAVAQNDKPRQNLQRAISLLDATMQKSFRGTTTNYYMVDVCDADNSEVSGPSDVWPYTAAIEAHCSVMEALNELKIKYPDLYEQHYERFANQLDVLIDNLAYYRGTYTLTSYATRRTWSVYAVPRAGQRNKGDVAGDNLKKNVYDDQMWLARELIRAYRLTGKEDYLKDAVNLTDYVIDGWDCWRDAGGNEYGGITWGPGYNSKHSCSNGPIIQPLVWLYHIYNKENEASNFTYYYRDLDNKVTSKVVKHSDIYLEFAEKVFHWQKEKLRNSNSHVYYDMLGADTGELQYDGTGASRRRAHVNNGGPTGTQYTYNSGTMLAGAVELMQATGDEEYKKDVIDLARYCYSAFSKPRRVNGVTYREWPTDATALQGFNVWFDNVLMRAYVDAAVTGLSNYADLSLESFQTNLDYAYDNYLRGAFLPINLIDGWGDSSKTKGFHQASFAAEYALLAIWAHRSREATAIHIPTESVKCDKRIYTLSGCPANNEADTLPQGIYIQKGQKIAIK